MTNRQSTILSFTAQRPALSDQGVTLGSAERALICQLSGYMEPVALLALLNSRRKADQGDNAPLVTMDALRAESLRDATAEAATPQGWGALRRLISDARRSGLLAKVRRSNLEDFAVVFSLTPAQVLQMKDVLSGPLDEAHGIRGES